MLGRMSRRGIFWQLFGLYTLLALAALGLVTLRARSALYQFARQQAIEDLEARARLFAEQVTDPLQRGDFAPVHALARRLGKQTGTRFTVVLPSGRVVAESDEDLQRMDNHRGRPEIAAAWRDRTPRHAIRPSDTVKEELVYLALPLSSKDSDTGEEEPLAVVRTAQPLATVSAAAAELEWRIAWTALAAVVAIAGLSAWMVGRLSRSLRAMAEAAEQYARGRFDHVLEASGPHELGVLARALQRMAAELKERFAQLAQKEHQRRVMLAGMSEGVLALDNEGCILELNDAAGQMFGVVPAAVVGRPLHEMVRFPGLLALVDRVAATGQMVREEITIHGPPERHLVVCGSVLQESPQRTLGTLLVLYDTTRLKQLETVRRDFVAAASHELRTPLTSIKGYAETLLDGALDNRADAERFVRTILGETNRLMALMADIFSLAQVENEAEQGQIATAIGPLRPVVEAALESCAQQAAGKQIRLELEGPAELCARINASLLKQAVINLIDNAIKYSAPQSTVRVVIGAEEDRAAIRVIDQGCGIEARHLPRLFERFYRVDKARSRALGGTGLGLAIVKHIALAHGGAVDVASQPGQGSTFSILLPVASLDTAEEQAVQ